MPARLTVLLVGAGAIGSHLLPLLARIPGVCRLLVVDRDAYEADNLVAQAITPADVGRPKATVQAARARRLNADLEARALVADLNDVPLGALRADVAFACLDSRAARRDLGERLWRLGVPMIDAGVRADGWLVRVSSYVPGGDGPCVACAWDDDDYASLAPANSCTDPAPAATGAPAALGALASSLAASLFLAGIAGGSEVVLDATGHRLLRSRLERNPDCRFDHEVWAIEPLPPAAASLADALAALGGDGGAAVAAEVEGQAFAGRLRCGACGQARRALRLASRLRRRDRRCSACGEAAASGAFDLLAPLPLAPLPAPLLRRPLRRLGVAAGDVLTLRGAGAARHFEVGTVAPSERRAPHSPSTRHP